MFERAAPAVKSVNWPHRREGATCSTLRGVLAHTCVSELSVEEGSQRKKVKIRRVSNHAESAMEGKGFARDHPAESGSGSRS